MKLCLQKMYSNTIFQKLNLKILQNFLTFDTKHKIFEIFKNSYFVLFAVTNVQKFFERLLLQNNLCDFILLLLKFDDFWSPKRPCFRILNCNRCFTPSPHPDLHVSLPRSFQTCMPLVGQQGRRHHTVDHRWFGS